MIANPSFLNIDTVPPVEAFPKDCPCRSESGKLSTIPPPRFLMDRNAAFRAMPAIPRRRNWRSTTKQEMRQSLFLPRSRRIQCTAAIVLAVVESWQLVRKAELAPTYRFAFRIYQDAVGFVSFQQFFLNAAISDAALRARWQPFAFRQRASAVKMDTETVVPAISLSEQLHKIGPSRERELFGYEF